MAVIVDVEADSRKLESALSRISMRFRGLGGEADSINKNLNKINKTKIDTTSSVNQLKKLNAEVNTTNAQIQRISSSLTTTLKGLGVSLSAALTGGGIVAASDSLLSMENRIALVTGRTQALKKAQEELYDISRKTYSSISNSVETFNRFGLALRDANYSQKDLLKAVESTQTALAISGGNAESASAAIFQLGQGLSSGTLRGAELNSVMEQAPRIATAIADELGVGVGALREMAAAGEITTSVVMRAMLGQATKLKEEFKAIEPTVGQLFGSFGDTFKLSVKSFDDAFAFTKTIKTNLKALTAFLNDNQQSIDIFFLSISTSAKYFIEDFSLIAGGILNVAKAIGSRLQAVIPVIIHPVLTFLDQYELLVSEKLLRIASVPLTGIVAIRAKLFSILDPNSFAAAILNMFSANSAIEFRAALDQLASSISTYGKRWYNIGNRVISVFRKINISIIETGIFMGLLNQRFLDLRYESFERLYKTLAATLVIFRELSLNFLTLPIVIDIIIAIDASVRLLRNSFKALFGSILAVFNIKPESRLIQGILETFKLLPSFAEASFKLYAGVIYGVLKLTKDSARDFLSSWLNLSSVFSELMLIDSVKNISKALIAIPVMIDNTIIDSIKMLGSLISFAISAVKTLSKEVESFEKTSKENVILTWFQQSFSSALSSLNNELLRVSSYLDTLEANVSKTFSLSSKYVDSFKEALSSLADSDFVKVLSRGIKQLEYWFFWLYDRVIGHSWWTDTMYYVRLYAKNTIDYVLSEFNEFRKELDSVFKSIHDKFKTLAEENNLMVMVPSKRYIRTKLLGVFDDPIRYLLSNLKLAWESLIDFAPEVGNQIGVALVTAFLAAFSENSKKAFLSFGKLTAMAFIGNQVFSSFGEEILDLGIIQQAFKSLGTEIGRFVKNVMKNIPVYFQIMIEGAKAFTQGFLEQFGLIGSFVNKLLNLIPEGGLLMNLFFGVSMSTLFLGFGKTKSLITNLVKFLTDTKSSIGATGIIGWMLFGKGRVLSAAIVAAVGILSTIPGLFNNFMPLLTLVGTAGLVSRLLFGTKGSFQIAATISDTVVRILNEFAGTTASFSFYDMLFANPKKNFFKDKWDRILSIIGETAEARTTNVWAFLESIDANSIRIAFSKVTDLLIGAWNRATGMMTLTWSSMVTSISTRWTMFVGFFEAMSLRLQFSFGALLSKLNSMTLLAGPIGLFGRVLFGALGVAAIIAMFAGAAGAAGDELLDFVSDWAWVGSTGLLGLLFLGYAKNPRLLVSTISNMVKLIGQIIIGFTGTIPALSALIFKPMTKASSVAVLLMADQFKNFGKIFSKIFGVGFGILSFILPKASVIISAVSRFVATIATSIFSIAGAAFAGVFAGIGLLAIWIFGEGDSLLNKLDNFASSLRSFFTGTTREARDLRREFEGIVTLTKVGTIEVDLKAKLEELNLGGLSEKQISLLRRELTLANKTFEHNQSIYETEGYLTRDKIAETNRAFTRANSYLDRIARKGEESFGSQLAGTLLGGLDTSPTGALSQALQKTLSDNLGSDIAKRVVSEPLNRLTEVMSDRNATDKDRSNAIIGLFDLLRNEGISSKELTGLFQQFPGLKKSFDRFGSIKEIMEGLSKGQENLLTRKDQASLLESFRTLSSGSMAPEVGQFVPSLIRQLAPQIRELATERGIPTTFEQSTWSGKRTSAVSPSDLAANLGLTPVDLLTMAAEAGIPKADAVLSIFKSTTEEISAAEKAVDNLNAKFAILGTTQADLSSQGELRDMLSGRLSQAGKTIKDTPEIDFTRLTGTEAKQLERILKDYDEELAAVRRDLIKENLDKLLDEGTLSRGILDKLKDNSFTDEVLNTLMQQNLSPLMTSLSRQAYDQAVGVLEASLKGLAESQEKAKPLLEQINSQFKELGLDLELEFLPKGFGEDSLVSFYAFIDKIEKKRSEFAKSGSEIDFLNLEILNRKALYSFGSIKQKIEDTVGLVKTAKPIDSIMLLSPEVLTRAARLGLIIGNIQMILQSMSTAGLDKSMQSALSEKARGYMRELEGLIGGAGSSDKSSKSGGQTWWERFLGNLSATGFSADSDLLASMSRSMISNLSKEADRFKKAQDAINKSTEKDVELRRKSLEIMRESRKAILSQMSGGTVGQVQTQLASLGVDIELPDLAKIDSSKLKEIFNTTMRISEIEDDLKFKRIAGSEATKEAGAELEQLRLHLEELTNASTIMRDAFSEGLTAFLKGEKTLMGVLEGLLDTFTNKIIEKFSDAFSDSLFDALGIDAFFDKLFSSMSNAGGSLGKTAGAKIAGSIADGASKEATADTGGFFGSLFSNIGSIFKSVFSWLGGIFGGGVTTAATGGLIRGPGTSTSDSIAALLSDGEYIINAASTKKYQPLLDAINSDSMPKFATGGRVGPSNPQAFKSAVQSNGRGGSQTFNLEITGDVSRQTRKEVFGMIKEITTGVNATNRERGGR